MWSASAEGDALWSAAAEAGFSTSPSSLAAYAEAGGAVAAAAACSALGAAPAAPLCASIGGAVGKAIVGMFHDAEAEARKAREEAAWKAWGAAKRELYSAVQSLEMGAAEAYARFVRERWAELADEPIPWTVPVSGWAPTGPITWRYRVESILRPPVAPHERDAWAREWLRLLAPGSQWPSAGDIWFSDVECARAGTHGDGLEARDKRCFAAWGRGLKYAATDITDSLAETLGLVAAQAAGGGKQVSRVFVSSLKLSPERKRAGSVALGGALMAVFGAAAIQVWRMYA